MPLLGEIVKTTQALRYHAKSTEVAGKNLSHVNDENYARQRVISRDGSMYREVGSLGTTALEMGGLDHARSELLDRRVVSEVGESATLEARKEILDLLQSVLGERVTREGVNVGLDDQIDSDLAPGSLTRALNDFFNAFQELSASPGEPTIRQELFHKVHTLGKRFNEAGEKFERIEGDVTETVGQSVAQVNAILEQLHEVNKQVRRFELQGKGKATTYRDRRQQLLESLAGLMDVKVEEDLDPTTGEASGLLNLFVTGAKGEKVNLLDPNGAKAISTDWGQELTVAAPVDPNGTAAKIRAKIGADGKLGQIEVLDGGSLYSDEDGPILVAFPPPVRKESEETVAAQTQATEGQVEAGADPEAALQAGQPVDSGPDLGAQTGTAAVADAGNGEAAVPGEDVQVQGATTTASGTVASVQIPFSTELGEVFHFEGSYYQALTSTAKGDNLSDESKFMKLGSIPNGTVREFLWRYSDLESFNKGDQFYHEGKLHQATSHFSPVVEEVGQLDSDNAISTSQVYAAGDVMLYNGVYFQAIETVQRLQSLPTSTTVGEKTDEGFLVLGDTLPSRDLPSPQMVDLDFATVDDGAGNLLAWRTTDQVVAQGQYLTVKDTYNNDKNKYYIALNDFNTHGDTVPFDPTNSDDLAEVMAYADKTSVKSIDRTQSTLSYKEGEILYDADTDTHYLVERSFPDPGGPQLDSAIKVQEFNPVDPMWESNLRKITPQLVGTDKTAIFRRANRAMFDPDGGKTVEVNLGLAEAILRKGEIVGFSILGEGNDYPPPDSIFVDGVELDLRSGSIHGYQRLRLEEMEVFRQHLNGLAKDFVTQINQIYNPEDEPGGYLFGFDAYLGRPIQNINKVMKEEYNLIGVEGEGEFTLFRDEVDMIVPYPEKDTFLVTYAAPVFPEELAGQAPYIRGDNAEQLLEENPEFAKIYASARRMKNVSVEPDLDYVGVDGFTGTDDDGRHIMLGYDNIPFRIAQGGKSFVFGDNFQFDSVPVDSWNIAKSMRIDEGFTVDNIKMSADSMDGANDIALAIAEKGNGEFTDQVSMMNTAIGNALSDVHDNLDHQKAVERLLLDERQAVSSVSIDEEVADLMRFQRSFQATAKVLSTLDRMLELVVSGLIR